MRIRRKVWLVYLLTLMPLLVMGVSLLYVWYSSQSALIEEDRLNNARLLATAFRTTVQDISSASRVIGTTTLNYPPNSSTPSRFQEMTTDFPIEWSVLVDETGRVLYSNEPAMVGESIEDAAINQALSGVLTAVGDARTIEGRAGFVVASRISATETTATAVAVQFVDIERLTRRLTDNEISGGAHIVDSRGHLVSLFEYPKVGSMLHYWGDNVHVRQALVGEETVSRNFIFPPTGERRVVAAVPIEPYGWVAAAGIDYDAAFGVFQRSLLLSVGAGFLVLLISGIGAALLARSLVRSVSALEYQAGNMGGSGVEPPTPLTGGDELATVSHVLYRTDIDLRAYIDGLEDLGDAGQLLASALSPEQARDAISSAARNLFSAQAVWVFRYDQETGMLVLEMWHSDLPAEEPSPKVTIAPGQSIAGRVFSRRRMEIVANVDEVDDFAFRDLGKRHGLHALVEIPLDRGGEPYGVLGMFVPSVERWVEGSREAGLLRAFGGQVATVLENARLYENERSVADILQQALLTLPDRIPGITYAHLYHSASQAARVGGDFYDLLELDEGRVGIVIGDVSGKGLEAAVLTSLVKNVVRAHANEPDKSPAQAMALTNNLLFTQSRPEQFVTLFLGYLDIPTGRFVYCNAAHPSAAVVRSDGSVIALEALSSLVGAFDNIPFAESLVTIAPGDLLLLYTDGVIESRRGSELYGEQRLFELLREMGPAPPQATVDRVFESVVGFTDGTLSDDLAILAISTTSA